MSFLLLTGSALLLGCLHGLGLDHLMAVAALAVDTRSGRLAHRRIVRIAVQFACGHMLVLAGGIAVALLIGWTLPEALAAGAERVGGAILLLLGGIGLWGVLAGQAYGHVHPELDGRSRWHVHVGLVAERHPRTAHEHSNAATIMGAVFAISSLRVLITLAPMGTSLTSLAVPVVLLLIALFGLGILVSMSVFGVLLARLSSLRVVEALGRAAGLVVAIASAALGAYWMMAN